jgi:ribonuclease HI
MKYTLWADGACKGNPGPMGIGMMLMNDNNEIVRQWSKHLGQGTNNIAELTAIKEGLLAFQPLGGQLLVCTDSQYSIGVLTLGWKAKANVELIRSIILLMKGMTLTFKHVKGHSGNTANDHVDRLASKAAEGVVYDSKGGS